MENLAGMEIIIIVLLAILNSLVALLIRQQGRNGLSRGNLEELANRLLQLAEYRELKRGQRVKQEVPLTNMETQETAANPDNRAAVIDEVLKKMGI